MRVEVYSKEYKEVWDNFVHNSKNGTFLFLRDFMEYHSDRFNDFSLLFYKEEKLIALLPGNLKDGIYYSHQGLSYGGLIMNTSTTTIEVTIIFEHLIISLRQQGIKEIVYKAIPHIYHSMPAEEDLYALFINKAQIAGRGVSSTLLLNTEQNYTIERKRGIKKAIANGLTISESDDYSSFWTILEENLRKRYNAKPVHTIGEISLLHQRFPDNIRLLGVYNKEDEMIAGTVLFVTDKVVHLQYIASSDEGKLTGATDILIDHITQQHWAGRTYFDYGISTENNGLYLNQGLIRHKEGFGARAITYDIYSIILS